MEYSLNDFIGKNQSDFLSLTREYIVSIYAGPRTELTEQQLKEVYDISEFANREVFEKNSNRVFTAVDLKRFK